jgi:hypothetical protein
MIPDQCMKGGGMRISSLALRLFAIASIGLLIGCGTKTRVSSQWKSPDYTGGPMHKILVVGVAETPLGRRSYEDRFADALRARGAEAVSSYQLLPTNDRLTKAELEATVRRGGFDGVIVSRLLEVAEETEYIPPSTYVTPSYGSRYGYYGYYGRNYDVVHTPGYTRTTEVVRLETRLWNAANSQLAWGVTSETFDPTSTDDAIASVTKKLVEKLHTDGLLN